MEHESAPQKIAGKIRRQSIKRPSIAACVCPSIVVLSTTVNTRDRVALFGVAIRAARFK
jgi:hypothetical protein